MDDCCNTDSALAAGIDNKLYDGRVHPHHSGDCHYRSDSRLHTRATWIVKDNLFVPSKLRKREVP